MKTIVALFHEKGTAQEVIDEVVDIGVARDHVMLLKNQEPTGKTTPSPETDATLAADVKRALGLGLAEPDAYHAEPVQDGGYAVTVKSDDRLADRAVEVVGRHRPFDMIVKDGDWPIPQPGLGATETAG